MALVLKRTSKWWYALFKSKGRRKAINLKVTVDGVRPPSLAQRGDDDFERSRGRAMAEHDRLLKDFESDRTGERTLQKLAEIKAGREVQFPALAELYNHWESIPRRKAPDPRYAEQCRVRLQRFADFASRTQRGISEFVAVKPATARAFLDNELKRGVAPKTWNDTLKLLRATFKHLHPHLGDGSNPFHGLVTKAAETINREPFTVEELQRILAACADDDFIRPIIITGVCTAMRRGDCCLLKWADVDGKAGFLSVKTAKTGETVDIPIFPLLQEELTKAKAVSGTSPYCFPEAASMYETNPDGITWRVKQVLAKAMATIALGKPDSEPLASPEILRRGLEYIESLGGLKRAVKMRAVFECYMEGRTLDEVTVMKKSSRGAVSMYLNEIERGIGCPVIRGKPRAMDVEKLQQEREHGKRRASTQDFHSFRVTWITLALAAGVPLELVQRVTGHRTTEVVLKHYFRPGREDFRAALVRAMPKMLGEGQKKPSVKDEMRQIIEAMTAKSLAKDRFKLLELLYKV